MLRRAFLANGELEAAYFDWSAALSRVEIASGYPNTNLHLGYSYAFSAENMKSFDRMTLSAGFDPMENLAYPGKVLKAGEIALAKARAAAERFRAMKFELQERVLSAWADYALLAETSRIQLRHLALSKLLFQTAAARVRAGGPQADLLRAEVELRTAEDRLRTIDAELRAAKHNLNGLLARDADAPLAPPARPESRALPADDGPILAAAVGQNPELSALAEAVEGRRDALELARLQWVPDINPSLAFTGSIAQAVSTAVVLPTTVFEIRGSIEEARAMLRSAEAELRQTRHVRASAYVAALVMLRNSERQAELFREQIIPAAEQVESTTRAAYSVGDASYLDLIESLRSLLDARLVLAESLAMREKRLAELEALAGIDFETLK
ncbi:TolC family protein [Tautonia sociabilis]|uniref:TolC family protein n=1 Tax=Tautonia sociabilis TaxID=2080755 RepID=UPI0013150CE4|nr:TolC family protein [Tautonia sociabilis]